MYEPEPEEIGSVETPPPSYRRTFLDDLDAGYEEKVRNYNALVKDAIVKQSSEVAERVLECIVLLSEIEAVALKSPYSSTNCNYND